MMLEIDSNDRIVMQSILFGQRFGYFGLSLEGIIASGDAFDRTIHGYEDLKSAMVKLLAAGLIEIRRDKVYLSSAYRKLRKQVKAENGKFDHETDLIGYVLKEFESKEIRLEDDVLSGFLSLAKWNLAYSNYQAGFQK